VSGRDAELGATQRLVHFIDRVAPVNFAVVADVAGPLRYESLVVALRAVQQRHPLLRVRVVRKVGRLGARWFFRDDGTTGPIALRTVGVEMYDESGLPRLVEQELATSFDTGTGPLARVAWASASPERHRLLLTLHHAVADGSSGAIVLRDLLAEAGETGANPAADAVTLNQIGPTGPHFPHMGGARRLWDLVAFFARSARHFIFRLPAGRNVSNLSAPAAGRTTGVILRRLSSEQTSDVLSAARAEGVTVGGVLSAALARSVYLASGAVGPSHVSVLNAVNVRPYVTAPDAAHRVDLLMSFVVTVHRVGDERGFYELARECADAVRRALDRREAVVPHTLAERLPSLDPGRAVAASMRVADRFATSASLTNIGRVDLPRQIGSLVLEQIFFVPSLGFMGRFAGVASSFGGTLSWNFVFVRPLMERELAERIADAAVSDLLAHTRAR
jgi:NRPS condensation-like uncharacterized protein